MHPDGTKLDFSGGTLLLAELEYLANSGKDASGLPGTYKFGAWHEAGAFPDQFTGSLDRSGNWGMYGVVDQMLWRRDGTEDQGLRFFMRMGGAPSDRNLVSWYVDGGLGFKGPLVRRPDDLLTLGVAYGRISDDAARADRLAGPSTRVRHREAVVELSYTASVAPGWTLQPDLQYVMPINRETIGDALLLGVRMNLAF